VKFLKYFVSLLLLSSLFVWSGLSVGAEGEKFEKSPHDRYVITFKDKSKGKKDVKNLKGEVEAEFVFSPNSVVVKELNEKAVVALSKNPNVESIEVDELVEPSGTYSAPFHDSAWTIESHNSDQAYSRGYSGQNVDIAVVDSGVDKNHPLLQHAIKGGTSLSSWTSDYQDNTGHGTMVAGSIAAKTSDGKPYGIAPDANIYGVLATVSETSGSAYVSTLARGIEWGVINGMDIVNISFDADVSLTTFDRASEIARESNIAVIHSGGNDKDDRDANTGRCDVSYCISAIDKNDRLAYFSAFGETGIEMAAGGVSVPVVRVGGTTTSTSSGTSFAAPIFAGLYALHKSEHPHASVNQIIGHMRSTAVDITTEQPIGHGKAYYSPLTFQSSENVLATWNYYYESSDELAVSSWDANGDKLMSWSSWELWEIDNTSNLNEIVVERLGQVSNTTAETTGAVFNVTLDENKNYLVKHIVDFSNGERQWEYKYINGFVNR
jgi:subtilisin family serine protease